MMATTTQRADIEAETSSAVLRRRAKTAPCEMTEAEIEYAEEGHIWEEALERERTCTGDFVPLEEVMRRYNAL